MGKKYVPSGYQIIEIDVTGKTNGQTKWSPSTEDEKILFDLLSKPLITKPILIHLIDRYNNVVCVPILSVGSLFVVTSSTDDYSISLDNGQFVCSFREE